MTFDISEGISKRFILQYAVYSLLLAIFSGCSGGSNPVGPTSSNVPTANDPPPGATLYTNTPTLTINNAISKDGETVSYDFELATDQSMNAIVASSKGIPQGPNGTTTWNVGMTLTKGTYWWRAVSHWSGNGTSNPISTGSGEMSPVSFTIARTDDEQILFLTEEFADEIRHKDLSMKGWDHTVRGYYQERAELEEDYRNYSSIDVKYTVKRLQINNPNAYIDLEATFITTDAKGRITTVDTVTWELKFHKVNNKWMIIVSVYYN